MRYNPVILALLLLYPVLAVLGQAGADPTLVESLIQKSGMARQMEQFPQLVQAGIAQANQQDQSVDQEVLAVVSTLAGEAFSPEVMLAAARNVLQANLSDEDIRAVLAWLASPSGTRATELEVQASSIQAYQEMQTMADQLLRDAGRVALIQRLDSALGVTESSVALALDVQSATVFALLVAVPVDQRPAAEVITNMVNEGRAQLIPYTEQQVLLSLLYTYRTFTEVEVERYIAFAQSESGKRYSSAVIQALHEATLKCAQSMWQRFTQQ